MYGGEDPFCDWFDRIFPWVVIPTILLGVAMLLYLGATGHGDHPVGGCRSPFGPCEITKEQP